MKLELIEDHDGVRVGEYRWEDPDGLTGGRRLYASIDGVLWKEIETYHLIRDITGLSTILVYEHQTDQR